MEHGKLQVGRGETHRIRTENASDGREYSREMTTKLGEYIDQFTIVPDLRTTDEILAREPGCCVGHKKPFIQWDKLSSTEQKKEFRRLCRLWRKGEENKKCTFSIKGKMVKL